LFGFRRVQRQEALIILLLGREYGFIAQQER
jgi:hypothetical protein